VFDAYPVRLTQCRYEPGDGLKRTHNAGDDYLLVLPYTHGGIRLQRGDTVLHDGPVAPGMVRLVAPGERSAMAARSRFEAARLSLPAAMLTAATESLAPVEALGAVVAARQDLRRLCPPLLSALELRGRQRDLVVEGLAMALIALIVGRASARGRRSGLDDATYRTAVEFADTHLRDGLTLQGWSAAVGLGVGEFSRRFRSHTGVAPYRWYMDRRVDEAARLLAGSERPIVDIALELGFSSQSHFTDVFSRRTGLAPGRWRASRR
jgi:AraC family transcriptional regulator